MTLTDRIAELWAEKMAEVQAREQTPWQRARRALSGRRTPKVRALTGYPKPHQGAREKARRRRQLAEGRLEMAMRR